MRKKVSLKRAERMRKINMECRIKRRMKRADGGEASTASDPIERKIVKVEADDSTARSFFGSLVNSEDKKPDSGRSCMVGNDRPIAGSSKANIERHSLVNDIVASSGRKVPLKTKDEEGFNAIPSISTERMTNEFSLEARLSALKKLLASLQLKDDQIEGVMNTVELCRETNKAGAPQVVVSVPDQPRCSITFNDKIKETVPVTEFLTEPPYSASMKTTKTTGTQTRETSGTFLAAGEPSNYCFSSCSCACHISSKAPLRAFYDAHEETLTQIPLRFQSRFSYSSGARFCGKSRQILANIVRYFEHWKTEVRHLSLFVPSPLEMAAAITGVSEHSLRVYKNNYPENYNLSLVEDDEKLLQPKNKKRKKKKRSVVPPQQQSATEKVAIEENGVKESG